MSPSPHPNHIKINFTPKTKTFISAASTSTKGKKPKLSRQNQSTSTTANSTHVHVNMYYALYGGYASTESPPHFTSPSEACTWGISRFKKDGLGNACAYQASPDFLQYVGLTKVCSSNLKRISLPSKRSSTIENAFFSNVHFYQVLDPTLLPRTSYVRCSNKIYSKIVQQFKEYQDYHFSSNSVYQTAAICECSTDIFFQPCQLLDDKIRASPCAFIQMEKKFQANMKNGSSCGIDELIARAHNYINLNRFRRIILSVCCGRSETESQSDDSDFSICLDIDKRSLFASKFAYKYVLKRKRSILFHHFDMNVGLGNLLESLSVHKLPIVVLFQHPSPSPQPKSRNAIARASLHCIEGLLSGFVCSIHYVFDHNESTHSWTFQELSNLAVSKCNDVTKASISVSNEATISQFEDTEVNHPVYGMVNRNGWALMKKGEERTFNLSLSKELHLYSPRSSGKLS